MASVNDKQSNVCQPTLEMQLLLPEENLFLSVEDGPFVSLSAEKGDFRGLLSHRFLHRLSPTRRLHLLHLSHGLHAPVHRHLVDVFVCSGKARFAADKVDVGPKYCVFIHG
jgi:hypothetical protein